MNKEEAMELLNVSSGSSNSEILKSYKQLFSDYQIRLTNAPTPHLKTLYQNNLKKLEDALKILLPEGGNLGNEDLPSVTPVISEQIQTGNLGNTAKTPVTAPKTTKSGNHNKIEKKTNSNILLPVLGLISVVSIALTVFVFMRYSGMYNSRASELEALEKENTELKTNLEKFEKNFASIKENGVMKITNGFSNEVIIAWWAVTYRDKEGNIRKFDSFKDGNSFDVANNRYKFPSYTLKPGQTQTMQYISGNDVVWDGSVVTYSLIALDSKNPGTFFLFSGIWNEDSKDGKLFVSKPKYTN